MKLLIPQGGRVGFGLCAVVWLALGVVPGCQSDQRTSDAVIERVDVDRLKALLAEPTRKSKAGGVAGIVLVDVRSPTKHTAGCIPNSINITLPNLHAADARLIPADPIVVYAENWEDSLGPAAVKRLISLGYENVLSFSGGMQAWREHGGKIALPGEGG